MTSTFEYDRMRKTREHFVVLACIMASLGYFAWMKKFVFFFGNVRKFVLLPRDDMTLDVNICSDSS